ncbi:hypothetical protein [Fervidibacillus halotolerans]|uniref:Uncharacterized protein n=1 Tax=Fervidibacillus halotolerans TaxID=2980027 RepID=A0A9E8LYJ8_9BACI|nr:hypothetical protein [Fervidibacillus halotolerans]WAA12087.1 hypothetical protein OE105_10970 [Fervidibacillus halotolerans]
MVRIRGKRTGIRVKLFGIRVNRTRIQGNWSGLEEKEPEYGEIGWDSGKWDKNSGKLVRIRGKETVIRVNRYGIQGNGMGIRVNWSGFGEKELEFG